MYSKSRWYKSWEILDLLTALCNFRGFDKSILSWKCFPNLNVKVASTTVWASMPLWMCLLTNTKHRDGMSKVCSNLAWRKSVLLKRNPKANTSFCQHFLAVGHVSLYYVCVTQWFFILGLGNKDRNLILMANNHFPSCKPSLFFVSCYTSMTTLIITKFLQGRQWNIFPSTRDSIL